jgi:S1-C subfamily serine protease
MMQVLGGEEGGRVRDESGHDAAAELVGWDPATGLAVLNVPGLAAPPIAVSPTAARVGHLALAVARSWSNGVTASAGTVAIIGGPLRTGRRRVIQEIIRTTAPMHEGFAGGAFVDVSGALTGITTAASIRGLGVIIPAAIAFRAAEDVQKHGRTTRGYLGIVGQRVRLGPGQESETRRHALLITGVATAGPAAAAGLIVGDLVTGLDGHPVASPEDLFDLLARDYVGRTAVVDVIRGGVAQQRPATIAPRPAA